MTSLRNPRLVRETRMMRDPSCGLEVDTIRQRNQVARHEQVLSEGRIWFEDDPRSKKSTAVFKTYYSRSATDYMTTGGVSSGWVADHGTGEA